jgi:hypothetical protein
MRTSADRLPEPSPSPRRPRTTSTDPRPARLRRALAGLVAVVFLGDLAS